MEVISPQLSILLLPCFHRDDLLDKSTVSSYVRIQLFQIKLDSFATLAPLKIALSKDLPFFLAHHSPVLCTAFCALP
jgi:hypothetical protein